MEKLREKANKLFDRIGPLKVTDEEIMRLADVEANDVKYVRVFMDVHSYNLSSETQP